jgi:uncharacterized protein YkwD
MRGALPQWRRTAPRRSIEMHRLALRTLAVACFAAFAHANDPRSGRIEPTVIYYAERALNLSVQVAAALPSDANAQAAVQESYLAYVYYAYCWGPWWTNYLDGSFSAADFVSLLRQGEQRAVAGAELAREAYLGSPNADTFDSYIALAATEWYARYAVLQGAPDDGLTPETRSLRDFINHGRQARGLRRLPVAWNLNQAAAGHAAWMAAANSASRVENNGSTPVSRAAAQGFSGRVVETALADFANPWDAYNQSLLANPQELAALSHPNWNAIGLARNGRFVSIEYGGPAALSNLAKYHNGPVMGRVRVVPVFVDAWWNTAAGSASRGYLSAAMAAIASGPLMDLMLEYSTPTTTIGRGYATAPATISGRLGVARVSNSLVQDILRLSMPYLPQPDENTLYMVMLPASVAGFADANLANACAFHSYYNAGSTKVFYAACLYDTNANMTSSFSHELVEAVTDPDTVGGWYDDTGEEVADYQYCNDPAAQVLQNGYYVQRVWSNVNGDQRVAP